MEDVKSIKKIDIHAHATAFPQYFPPFWGGGQRFISAEETIAFYDRLGIEKGVLQPLVAAEAKTTPSTTEECKYIVDKHPDRFILFCNVDPRAITNTPDADFSGILAFYKEKLGAKGLGELTANLYADDKRVDNLFGACSEMELPVTIHLVPDFISYGLVDELGLPRLEKMLKKHPKLKILGHSEPFWSEISADNTNETRGGYPQGKIIDGKIAELMRNYEGLYCDLSAGSGTNAMTRDPEYTARFVEEFSDRILYGCDFTATSNTHPFKLTETLEKMLDDGVISPKNYKKIVRDNAVKLLKL
ncbi:MAG: amidohydrolase family protein [Oscillospiraceae bacterium]|nr:amidohydrolase family protein [Oscillospiraceae bacterium]